MDVTSYGIDYYKLSESKVNHFWFKFFILKIIENDKENIMVYC